MKYINVMGLPKPVSELVMGTLFGDTKQQELFNDVMNAYVEAGGNILDTGRFYGACTESEVCIREWLHAYPEMRSKIMIMDKCCHPFINRKGYYGPDSRWRFSGEFVTEDLEYSLDRMDVEYMDLYMPHRDKEDVPVGEIMDRLERHRKEGKIIAYGVSNWRIPRVEEAVKYCKEHNYQGLSMSSPSYSLATMPETCWKSTIYINDEQARYYTDQLDMPIFSWSSQGSGFFAEAADTNQIYTSDANAEKMKRAKELATKHGVSALNIALAYILNQGLKIAAIVGPRQKSEVLNSVAATDIKLTSADIEYLSLRSDHR